MSPDTIFDLQTQHKARYPQSTRGTREGVVSQGNLLSKASRAVSKFGEHLIALGQKMQASTEKPTMNLGDRSAVES